MDFFEEERDWRNENIFGRGGGTNHGRRGEKGASGLLRRRGKNRRGD